jgi:hypothetical protein
MIMDVIIHRRVSEWGRFLAPWPVKPAQAGAITSWCLNGHHDMYSGGRGYFRTVLSDPRFARQQRSNRFVLRHPKWEILGLDTAWTSPRSSHKSQPPGANTAKLSYFLPVLPRRQTNLISGTEL